MLAEIPDLFGKGFTAQMTYYETPSGAKVFAAGAFTLAGSVLSDPTVGTVGRQPPGAPLAAMSRQSLVLTFDVEDWHQLVHRRLGLVDWDQARPALPRQVDSILDRLDGLGVRATFFLLGLTVRRYPQLAAEIAARGHEIACHGDAHRPVHTQTAAEFRDDLQAALETIEVATGRVATGYRAPLFSINRNTPWAYEVLADLGFRYDASQYDSASSPEPDPGHPRRALHSRARLRSYAVGVPGRRLARRRDHTAGRRRKLLAPAPGADPLPLPPCRGNRRPATDDLLPSV